MNMNDIGNMVIPFGKFKGKTFDYLIRFEKAYLEYMLQRDVHFFPEVRDYILEKLELVMPPEEVRLRCECGDVLKSGIAKKGDSVGRPFLVCPNAEMIDGKYKNKCDCFIWQRMN